MKALMDIWFKKTGRVKDEGVEKGKPSLYEVINMNRKKISGPKEKSLVLSRSDFDKVSNEIANPSEPSEKLVNAFRTNKSVIEDE